MFCSTERTSRFNALMLAGSKFSCSTGSPGLQKQPKAKPQRAGREPYRFYLLQLLVIVLCQNHRGTTAKSSGQTFWHECLSLANSASVRRAVSFCSNFWRRSCCNALGWVLFNLLSPVEQTMVFTWVLPGLSLCMELSRTCRDVGAKGKDFTNV